MNSFDDIVIGEMYSLRLFHFFVLPTKKKLETFIRRHPWKANGPFVSCEENKDNAIVVCQMWGHCGPTYLNPSESFMIVEVDATNRCVKILGNDKMGWIDLGHREDEVEDIHLLEKVTVNDV